MSLPPGPPPLTHEPEAAPAPSSDIPLWLVLALVGVLVAAAGLVAVVLINGTDDKEAKGPSYPDHWDAQIEPYVRIVEKERGLTFVHPVEVRYLTGAEFEKNVTADEKDLDKDAREEIRQFTGLARAIGLIGGDVDLFKAFNDAYGSGTLAYYSYKDERVTIRGKRLTLAAHATLVHELTHALQDQRFDIGDRQQAMAKKSDAHDGDGGTASSVFDSVIEGDAERVATRYRESLPPKKRQALAAAEARNEDSVGDAYADIPKVVLTLISSPYTLGQTMVSAVAEKGGNAAVDALFRDPPAHEAALLDPMTLVAGQSGAVKVETPAVAEGEKKFAADEFGALSLYLVLAERLPLVDALTAADGWGGDRYVAFDRDGTTCARMRIAGDSGQDTSRLLEALRRWVDAGPHAEAIVRRDGDVVTFESCDPGKKARTVNDASGDALTVANIRAQLGTQVLHEGAPVSTARCFGDRVVRAFPISTLTAAEISAADQARLRQLAVGCR